MHNRLPYKDIFGGVSALTLDQFKTVNGFSNKFWGWGGEDDDMANRLKYHDYHISRYAANIARYKMLPHRRQPANPKRYSFSEKIKASQPLYFVMISNLPSLLTGMSFCIMETKGSILMDLTTFNINVRS